MFSNGGSRTGNQAVKNYPGLQMPKGLSFRIFKGPTVSSSTFPSLPVYAGSGPFAGTTAHFDIGYHSIPLNDSSRNRRTSLYPSGISTAPSIYAPPRDHLNTAQYTSGVSPPASSSNSSSGVRPVSNSRSNSNTSPNSSSNKNHRQFSIYASNVNQDTFIYEASDICSNSEYSSSHVSPSPVPYSPALSTDSTVTLRSPLSTSSLLQPPDRAPDRATTPAFQKGAPPPLGQAQDALRDILGNHTTPPSAPNTTFRTTSPGSNGLPRRSSPPQQAPRRRDSGIIPTFSLAENDVDTDTETESDRIAWRNAERNSSYSSVPAMAMGRRRTLSTLSNISSSNISSTIPVVPLTMSYFPPPEPLPNPPRPASFLSTDSTGIRTATAPSLSSLHQHQEVTPDPLPVPHAAYASASAGAAARSAGSSSSSSTIVIDRLGDQVDDTRFFDEVPLRSSPVEMLNEHRGSSSELPAIPDPTLTTIYSTGRGVDRYPSPSDNFNVSSGVPAAASSSSSDRSALNYSPSRHSASRTSPSAPSSSPSSRAAVAAVSVPAPPDASSLGTQGLPLHEGRSFVGSFVPSEDAYYSPAVPETATPAAAQPAYTRFSLMQVPVPPAINPPTAVEQVSTSTKLTSHHNHPPSQPSQHISQSNRDATASVEAAADVSHERRRSSRSRNSISGVSGSGHKSDRSTSNSPPLARSQVPAAGVQWPSSSVVGTENVQPGLNRAGTMRTQVEVAAASSTQQLPSSYSSSTQPAVTNPSPQNTSRRVRTTSISSVQVQETNKRDSRRSAYPPDAPSSIPVQTPASSNTRRTSPEIPIYSTPQYPPTNEYPKPEPRRRFTDESNPSLADATRRAATPFRSEFIPSLSTSRAHAQSQAQAQSTPSQGKPERSRSDGDQLPIANPSSAIRMTTTQTQAAQVTVVSIESQLPEPINPAQRTVRWNQRLVCPSPIHLGQRRKGWFNRRGDQLWTNGGLFKSPPPGEEYPVDLDDYPDFNEGWMNEEGTRIDLGHRLIPKPPLRSALKRTSQNFN